MIYPNPEVRTAILNLSGNRTAFDTVVQWMNSNLQHGAADLVHATAEEVPKLQRECQVWDLLCNFFNRVDEDDIQRLEPQLPIDFTPNTRSRIGQCCDADSDKQQVNTPQGTHNT